MAVARMGPATAALRVGAPLKSHPAAMEADMAMAMRVSREMMGIRRLRTMGRLTGPTIRTLRTVTTARRTDSPRRSATKS